MRLAAVLILLRVATLRQTEALVAYDCHHENTTYQVIDLIEPAPCPDPERDYDPPIQHQIQLVQVDTQMPVKAHRCKVMVSKKVTRCGFNSLVYGSTWPVWLQETKLTPTECRQAVEKGKMTVEGKTYEAPMDQTTPYRFYSRGQLSDNMDCTYVAGFESGGRWFWYSTEETILDITVSTVRGTADTATGQAIFGNGIRANYKDLVIRDAIEGMLVWDSKEPGCSDTVSEIFRGEATLHRRHGTNGLVDAVVMIRHNATDQFAGLVLKAVITTCDIRCFTTQIRGLVVCPYREGDKPVPKREFRAHFSISQVDLQTQLGFLHVTTNMAAADRFARVQSELCNVDRRTLFNKLQAIAGANNQYALMDLYGAGHQVTQGGAAVYVTRCTPVDVTRVEHVNCTQEVPASYNNCLLYTSPSPRDKRQSRMPSSA